MLRRIAVAVCVVFAALYAVGFALPDQVHVERETLIDAPQDEFFALVADLRQWEKWSPWRERDPNAQYEISEPGVGQTMRWRSERSDVGSGVQKIVALARPVAVVSALDFGDMGRADAKFLFSKAESGQVRVRWTLDTKMRHGAPFLMKPVATYMGYFMDGMIGADYERGLANLKRVAEQR